MNDRDCTAFLQWALPRMDLRWPGFRRVRRQVCRRLARRLDELGLGDLAAYRVRLERDAGEWRHLDGLCAITISRFWRDRRVYDGLAGEVLPALAARAVARGNDALRCWSAGCASGEEPCSLVLAWRHRAGGGFPGLALAVVATDASPLMIGRARAGRYTASSLAGLPPEWIATDFTRDGDAWRVAEACRGAVDFRVQDIRVAMPAGPFDLVLCRNLVFTYFAEPLQRALLEHLRARLLPGGALVIGIHESLPGGSDRMSSWPGIPGVYVNEAC